MSHVFYSLSLNTNTSGRNVTLIHREKCPKTSIRLWGGPFKKPKGLDIVCFGQKLLTSVRWRPVNNADWNLNTRTDFPDMVLIIIRVRLIVKLPDIRDRVIVVSAGTFSIQPYCIKRSHLEGYSIPLLVKVTQRSHWIIDIIISVGARGGFGKRVKSTLDQGGVLLLFMLWSDKRNTVCGRF